MQLVNQEHVVVKHANQIKILWKWKRFFKMKKKNRLNIVESMKIIIIDSN